MLTVKTLHFLPECIKTKGSHFSLKPTNTWVDKAALKVHSTGGNHTFSTWSHICVSWDWMGISNRPGGSNLSALQPAWVTRGQVGLGGTAVNTGWRVLPLSLEISRNPWKPGFWLHAHLARTKQARLEHPQL